MSFASPVYLLGLLLVPLVAAAWFARRHRIRRYAHESNSTKAEGDDSAATTHFASKPSLDRPR